MKIALIQPPYLIIYKKLNIDQKASIPIGMLSLAGMLEKKGHEVKVIDMELDEILIPELIEEVRSFGAEMVGLTAVTPTFNAAQEITVELKKSFA